MLYEDMISDDVDGVDLLDEVDDSYWWIIPKEFGMITLVPEDSPPPTERPRDAGGGAAGRPPHTPGSPVDSLPSLPFNANRRPTVNFGSTTIIEMDDVSGSDVSTIPESVGDRRGGSAGGETSAASYDTSVTRGSVAYVPFSEEDDPRGARPPTGRRDSQWSITNIRRRFREVRIEDMYRRYWLRLQRLLLFKLFIIIIVFAIVLEILYFTIGYTDTAHPILYYVTAAVTGLLASLGATMVFVKRIYIRTYLGLALSVCAYFIIGIFLHTPFMDRTSVMPMDGVPGVFYIIFVVHTMLPLSRKVSTAIGTLIALCELLIVGLLSEMEPRLKNPQLIANIVIFISSNVTGLYHKHLTDIGHRHTFLDTRKFLEADIKYSRQRERLNRMKEGLLLKIIPRHMLEDIKLVLHKKMLQDPNDPGPQHVAFHHLMIQCHTEVSILYADIVNFTPLTSVLDAAELVRSLNELFGRFDELAKHNSCLRIKMLGDCYYCVSGLPEGTEYHARNCVMQGMQMIKIIRHMRERTGMDRLDMRIGVHSGLVMSGVIGLKKWQYDIWSDDVTIANHMECGGLAGRVHLTDATLKKLDGEFKVEPAEGGTRDELLRMIDARTYFVTEQELDNVSVSQFTSEDHAEIAVPSLNPDIPSRAQLARRRHSVCMDKDNWGAETPFNTLSDYMMEKTMPEAAEVNKKLERAFHLEESDEKEEVSNETIASFVKMSASQLFRTRELDSYKPDQELSPTHISLLSEKLLKQDRKIDPWTLRFRDPVLEYKYANRKDPTFKFYIAFCAIIFLFMLTVQYIILQSTLNLWISTGCGLAIFLTLIILVGGPVWIPKFKKFPEQFQTCLRTVADTMVTHRWWKIFLTVVSNAIIFIVSIIPVMDCQSMNKDFNATVGGFSGSSPSATENPYEFGLNTTSASNVPCLFATYYMYSSMLALVSCSVFLRVSHVVKMTIMLIGLGVFNLMFYSVFYHVFELYDAIIRSDYLSSRVRGTLVTSILFITLVTLDRQIERNHRLDFLHKVKIQQDKDEVRRNAQLNELLLANILPRHVADHFMNPDRPKNELYHQQCQNVCVMFAAIPGFKAFFGMVDVTGNECLRLLNEIVSAFDRELGKFDGVEKIKTIGSTYMTATGLDCGSDTVQDSDRARRNVSLMVQFALCLMECLDDLSKDLMCEYKLRVGLDHGPVVAGVVGAQKPQYDIWGNTVNVASRMETYGVIDHLQMREDTAELLSAQDGHCDFREEMNIKGKGMMRVYTMNRAQAQAVKHFSELRPPGAGAGAGAADGGSGHGHHHGNGGGAKAEEVANTEKTPNGLKIPKMKNR